MALNDLLGGRQTRDVSNAFCIQYNLNRNAFLFPKIFAEKKQCCLLKFCILIII